MPGMKNNYFNCVLCTKRTKPKERRKCNASLQKFLRKSFFVECEEDSVLCNKCRHKYYKTEAHLAPKRKQDSDSDSDFEPPHEKKQKLCSPPSIPVPLKTSSRSHAYCCICRKPGPKLVVVSSKCRMTVLVKKNIWVPLGSRCCPTHITNGELKEECLEQINVLSDQCHMNRSTLIDILNRLRDICIRQNNVRLDFDNVNTLSDDDYLQLTGLSKSNFNDLFDCLQHYVKVTPARSQRTSLALFLCKMQNGMSNKLLATLYNVSKSSVRRAVHTVSAALMKVFVPNNLGFQHLSRQTLIESHTRPLAQKLFGNMENPSAILVLDGTYIYIEKSNNFLFQRRSYSLHKGRPLVKPMVITSTSGYFVSILGPYFADSKNNDASILNHILKSNIDDIRHWVQEEDVFVVDRGFRDSLSLLEDLGITAQMPKFKSRGEKQLNTEDANISRLVTKVRWVVESANARIKSWKYLSKTLPTNQVPYIGDYVRIVCAISNKYHPPLAQSTNPSADEAEATKMLHLSQQVNSLQLYLEENGLLRKTSPWKQITDADLLDFPTLSDDQLRDITCGSYQLKLSSSYIQEYVDNDSDLFFHKDDPTLLRIKIQSRHTSSKKYTVWIRYNNDGIVSWYCLCPAGARVVGVCSHIAAMLWYLGGARFSGKKSFGVRDPGKTIEDAAILPEIIDESGSGSDTDGVEHFVEE